MIIRTFTLLLALSFISTGNIAKASAENNSSYFNKPNNIKNFNEKAKVKATIEKYLNNEIKFIKDKKVYLSSNILSNNYMMLFKLQLQL